MKERLLSQPGAITIQNGDCSIGLSESARKKLTILCSSKRLINCLSDRKPEKN